MNTKYEFEPGSATFEDGSTREVSVDDITLIRALRERRFWTNKDAFRFVIACRAATGAMAKEDLLRLQDELSGEGVAVLVGAVPRIEEIEGEFQVYDSGCRDCFE